MAAGMLMSVDEFAALPEDGQMHELVEGELQSKAPPHFLHAQIVYAILNSLMPFASAGRHGRAYPGAGFLLAGEPPTVRQPDIGFVRAKRLAQPLQEGYFPGGPDLAIEVVSPSDKAGDLELEVRQYLAAGAQAVAVVYPRSRSIWVHLAGGPPHLLGVGGKLEFPDLLPGWSMAVGEVFAPLDEGAA